MKEKVISDIRIYKSNMENIDEKPLPSEIDNKALQIIIHRIVMKLREKDFSLGIFDHLYLNFTVCEDENSIVPAKRTVDAYHPWYRYYDIGINEKLYYSLQSENHINIIISFIEKILLQHFTNDEESQNIVTSSIEEAVLQKENMLMQYKVKETKSRKAVLFLRYLDNAHYFPLLCVYDSEGNKLLHKDLHITKDLNLFGTIQLSNKKVTIKPRTNIFSKNLLPITYEF